MEEIIKRLAALKAEAKSIRDKLYDWEDGEIIGSPLYQAMSAADEVAGDLLLRQYAEGTITFAGQEEVAA